MVSAFPAPKRRELYYPDDAFSRLDESNDAEHYAEARMVAHLDRRALATVERIIGTLTVEESPAILDLMASWDSHVPKTVQPSRLVGLGMNAVELRANERLDSFVVHDLNQEPHLPFEDGIFDVVLNTVSVAYLTRPFEVFAEVARVLAPGGLHLVVFSSRVFRPKAAKIWRQSDDTGRQILVEDFLRSVPAFGRISTFVSMGQPRPRDDKYAGLGLPSDPVWAVWAEKKGASAARAPRPAVSPEPSPLPSREVIEARKARVGQTLECPYCEEKLVRWDVEPGPFNEWPNEFFWVCFNNDCPYLIQGWAVMAAQGAPGFSYRLVYNPDRDCCMPIAIPNVKATRDYYITPRG
jgi:SAM-dependent methyltransferase